MNLTIKLKENYKGIIISIAAVVALLIWKPNVLIEGIQRSCMYGAIALPMALALGVVKILNMAHGDFMMFGSYFGYWFCVYNGMDPFMAMIPAIVIFFIIGMITYKVAIKKVLTAPFLNQLLLTFGIAMVLTQIANIIWTSMPIKLSIDYVSDSATFMGVTFGTFEFVYVLAAVVMLAGLQIFLKKTRPGQAALAVGENPRGARIVGINVDRIYLLVFSISVALIGAFGILFMMRNSIFPGVGGPFNMKSFCLIAMAGEGNLTGIMRVSLILGLAENFVLSFADYSGWADIIFFAIIVAVIMIRTHQERVK